MRGTRGCWLARGATQPDAPGAREAALEVRARPGTLRPAAEDGVGKTGAALRAPHQLHQLFSQFGHDGVAARGSLLSGLLPWNMGKGRLRRQELRDGSGQGRGRFDARTGREGRCTCRDPACQTRSDRQL